MPGGSSCLQAFRRRSPLAFRSVSHRAGVADGAIEAYAIEQNPAPRESDRPVVTRFLHEAQ
jgi:hypothetical protein